jgi:hypothetical protein
MAAQKSTFERLDEVIAACQRKPASTPAPFNLGEMREIAARIGWLTDMVVSAAALHFGELSRQEREYAEEELQLVAADLAKSGPRHIPRTSRGGK